MNNAEGDVWVFLEHADGKLKDISLELAGKGRELADELGASLGAVLLGDGSGRLSDIAFEYGIDAVYAVDAPELSPYRAGPWQRAVAGLVERHRPQIVLFGATSMGREIAPGVASALRCGLTADCTELKIGSYDDRKDSAHFGNLLHQIRPAFGGNILATIVSPRTRPQMATVREGVMKAIAPVKGRRGRVIAERAAFAGRDLAVEVEHIAKKTSSVNLKGAPVVVAGGAGMGSKEAFGLLSDLAELLGGEVGASRAAVDLGYASPDRQIGQTGVTVRPRLFVSCGISGAVQHIAGMQDSAKILVINSDPGAPIFRIAHYGIVADAREVLPMLIGEIKNGRR